MLNGFNNKENGFNNKSFIISYVIVKNKKKSPSSSMGRTLISCINNENSTFSSGSLL